MKKEISTLSQIQMNISASSNIYMYLPHGILQLKRLYSHKPKQAIKLQPQTWTFVEAKDKANTNNKCKKLSLDNWISFFFKKINYIESIHKFHSDFSSLATVTTVIITHLASQICVWHGCKWNFAGPQIYLQPTKIKSQHFGFFKCLV